MALPVPPIAPSNPIPNNPFYYPETNYIRGEYGPFIVGAGLVVNNLTGEITVTGGPGGAVATISAGPGIFASQSTGNVTLANTGVISLSAGPGISISGVAGNLTITNTAPATTVTGTVYQVSTGVGLTGGPITGSGTISLTNTGVAPGTYNNANVTVDAQGRITAITTGAGGGAGSSQLLVTAPLQISGLTPQTLSIATGSTTGAGIVQLNSSINSSSTTTAATPSAVKTAYDLATTACSNSAAAIAASTAAGAAATNAQTTANSALSAATAAVAGAATAVPCAAFTAKGQLLAGTGASTFSALAIGANGRVLTACSSCAEGFTWAVLPPTGTVTTVATGLGLTGGPITSSGTISLANTAVTPGTYSNATFTVDGQGRLTSALSGPAPTFGTVTSVATGTGLTGGPITASGTISLDTTGVTAGAYTYASFAVDANGRITSATSGANPVTSISTGTGLTGGPITGTGTIALANTAVTAGSYTYPSITVDAQGRLTAAADGTVPVLPADYTAKGTLLVGTAPSSPVALAAGTDGQVLTACSAYPNGVGWAAAPPTGVVSLTAGTGLTGGTITSSGTIALNSACVIAPSIFTASGQLLGYNGTAPVALPVGTDGQVLTACAACAGGVTWFGSSGGPLCGFTQTATPFNTALGCRAGCSLTTGTDNVLIGYGSGRGLTTGSGNTFVGRFPDASVAATTACNNTLIGNFSNFGLTTGCNNIGISGGTGSPVFALTLECNLITMGSLVHTNAYINIPWTVVSDVRDKKVNSPVALGLDFAREITPIAYQRCDRTTREVLSPTESYGFSAQQLAGLEQKYLGKNVIVDIKDEDRLKITDDFITPVLVNAIKELANKVDELQKKVDELTP